ncbi:hypothetical protein B0A54_09812 [Friedmanniomyces endolithicus]|uniref:UmuC domain-containing protein n=1 Tax=Friedmanniomyces endolithicus TaxID=329885 RepID=A0A4U0UPQ8_9PEZI|nr:hypothetical protein LTS09_008010 [Friedmanniomyces endolithicus]TKA37810.1 hypothetical protein B0A54_09812 [Friedmanniomyces endolithicus]
MDTDRTPPARKDGRVIIHFDYDCFYASVFEKENPALKSLPFAVQQKQIIVTCNYEARRRGLHKLQLIRDARRICPDVVIELGEDISRFRDASKELYNFLKGFSWSRKVERLGFDEVWLDVSDIVDYNMQTLNRHGLVQCFFQTSRSDPMEGFSFDASTIAGHPYPQKYKHVNVAGAVDDLTLRMHLGSHLAQHMRHQLEQQKGYTSTVGIATTKLLSKLVGNLNKPKGQTTIMPPLTDSTDGPGNLQTFLDDHEIGKIPGIGFKLSQKLRDFILERPAAFDTGLIYGGTKEHVTVADVRGNSKVSPETLEKLLSGPGSPHGIGHKVWCLLHGADDTEVSEAKAVPSQISIEDSYIRLDTLPDVLQELDALARSLITRMRIDLLVHEEDASKEEDLRPGDLEQIFTQVTSKKWLAHPKTLRLTTRPRSPLQPDGTRIRSFKRISHSAPLPNFVFGLSESVESLADRLVREALLPMYRKLHPEKSGWNLSLVNLAVTNMAETAGESKTARGRDIGNMFRRQDDVLKDFQIREASPSPAEDSELEAQVVPGVGWDDDVEHGDDELECCGDCGTRMPAFAMVAHRRFHLPALSAAQGHFT